MANNIKKAPVVKRDNFPAPVARALAERAGFVCSNPNCRRSTIGPSPADPSLSIYSGEAAHITAAAERGPRFDKTLTKEQRSSADNGIHLCASCADIIDKNEGAGFSVELLREWKSGREAEASAMHGTGDIALISDSVDFSYQPDFRILREQSKLAEDSLADFAQIEMPGGVIRIKRDVDSVIAQAARDGSVLVVGEPGAGKSGASFRAMETLIAEGHDVIALPVEDFVALSRGQLREELGLTHDLLNVLTHWPGETPAYIFVDALDAARDWGAARALRQMIAAIHKHAPRWYVVASIRKYDLRHSDELRREFRGEPVQPFIDPEFSSVRHVNIPLLTDAELNDSGAQSEVLRQLLERGGEATSTLLRNVFNLRLAAELIVDGIDIGELAPIRTQVELLDRYWERRVTRPDGNGDARQLVIDRTVDAMINTRSLQVERKIAIDGDAKSSEPLQDLLHDQVLAEWQRSPEARAQSELLGFSHHIIFDYAVSRLLRGHSSSLIQRLASDTQFVLALRPSVVMHYHYLWNLDATDRMSFWESLNDVSESDEVPTIGKLIGPSVAASLIQSPQDYSGLLVLFEAARTPEKLLVIEATIQALRGAIVSRDEWNTNADKTTWCQFVRDLASKAESSSEVTMRVLAGLIADLGRRFQAISAEGQHTLGEAARILFQFARRKQPYNSWIMVNSIDAVCQSFATDPAISVGLLRILIEPERINEYGFMELPRLADHIEQIATLAPDFAVDIYAAAYAHEEESQEKTLMYGSLLMPLSSNRRQDYEMTFYTLQESYPKFLEVAPIHATRALVKAMEAFADKKVVRRITERSDEPFDWNGTQALFRTDASSMWGASYDGPTQMLEQWGTLLETQWSTSDDPQVLNEVIKILVAENRDASVWARLLKGATGYPDQLGDIVLPLLSAVPVLWSLDTRYGVGEALRTLYPRFNGDQRLSIEQAILSIPGYLPEDTLYSGENQRDTLLGCLKRDLIVSDTAKEILTKLEATGEPLPENREVFRMREFQWERATSEHGLVRKGVDIDQPRNRAIQALIAQAEEFAHNKNSSQDTLPSDEEIFAIIPVLRTIQDALSSDPAESLPDALRTYGWGYLAEACRKIVRCTDFKDEDVAAFVRQSILSAAQQPDPRPDAARDKQFEQSPSWGIPAPRITAAEVIMLLAQDEANGNDDILALIQQLADDPVAAVRYQVFFYISSLEDTAPDLMWQLLEHSCANETNQGVLEAVIHNLSHLFYADTTRAAALGKMLLGRISNSGNRGKLAASLAQLYVLRNPEDAKNTALSLIASPVDHHKEVNDILSILRGVLIYGPIETPLPDQEEARKRGIILFQSCVENVISAIDKLKARHGESPFFEWEETDKKTMHDLQDLLEHAALQVYFGSGAYKDGNVAKNNQGDTDVNSLLRCKRFLGEGGPLLDLLAATGNARVAYNLMKTFEHYVPASPHRVLQLIGTTVSAATAGGGLQYESMASSAYVRCIEQYLRDYRDVLQEPEHERLLVRTLDAFVKAGWEDAIRLAYKLDEISR